MAESI